MYDTVCTYLGFTPDPSLYAKVSCYLLSATVRFPVPEGFARYLSELRPSRPGLEILDVWTRLLMPSNPWRHRFNAVVAIHECDPRGYREMMAGAGAGVRAWGSAVGAALSVLFILIAGAPWLSWHGCRYLFSSAPMRRERRAFAGATVLITGASRGLGLALVGRLLSLGAKVVALAREGNALESLGQQAVAAGLGKNLRVAAADVTKPNAVVDAIRALGIDSSSIDIVVVNAGVKLEPGDRSWEEIVAQTFAVNVFGAMRTAAAVLPAWRSRGHGHLVFVSSLGRWHGMVKSGAYNASKAALSVLAESMAMDLRAEGPSSVRCTVVEPGLIGTGMTENGFLQRLLSVDPENAAARIVRSIARRRTTCRFPLVFVLMTLAVAALPLSLRVRLLGKVKSGP